MSRESRVLRGEYVAVRGEFEYMSVRVNFAFEKSEICIENSIKPNGGIRGGLV